MNFKKNVLAIKNIEDINAKFNLFKFQVYYFICMLKLVDLLLKANTINSTNQDQYVNKIVQYIEIFVPLLAHTKNSADSVAKFIIKQLHTAQSSNYLNLIKIVPQTLSSYF